VVEEERTMIPLNPSEKSRTLWSNRRHLLKAVGAVGAVGALNDLGGSKFGLAPITSAQAQSEKPIDHKIFELDSAPLQSGVDFRNVKVSYKTYGQLAGDKSNVIVCPSAYGGDHGYVDWLTSAAKVFDPNRYFIISISMLGNGLSSSPSNTPAPFDGRRYPMVTLADNVHMQRRLVTELFGVQKIALVWGWSMGGQQAYHWGALFPDMVERICVVCGSARTSVNNLVFLAGIEAALKADSLWQDDWFAAPPIRGLKAFARVYAGWVVSPEFYRQELYKPRHATLEDALVGYERFWLEHDANNLLAQLWTWQQANISDNDVYRGDLVKALSSIKAKALIMPSETDRYFLVDDNAREMPYLTHGELRPIRSIWGHLAAIGGTPEDTTFLAKGVSDLLSS
jgi:homoserine O-acetyltransferase/O-succinyltransferase